MTKKMNFEVGDIVIALDDADLWNNIYHFQKFINAIKVKMTVKQVDVHGGFTTSDDVDFSSYEDREDWRKQYSIYTPEGKSLMGSKKVYNWTKNKAGIELFFQKKFDEALNKCNEDDANEIRRLELIIKETTAKIEMIKAGNRGISYQSNTNERDFINQQIVSIKEILNSL